MNKEQLEEVEKLLKSEDFEMVELGVSILQSMHSPSKWKEVLSRNKIKEIVLDSVLISCPRYHFIIKKGQIIIKQTIEEIVMSQLEDEVFTTKKEYKNQTYLTNIKFNKYEQKTSKKIFHRTTFK